MTFNTNIFWGGEQGEKYDCSIIIIFYISLCKCTEKGYWFMLGETLRTYLTGFLCLLRNDYTTNNALACMNRLPWGISMHVVSSSETETSSLTLIALLLLNVKFRLSCWLNLGKTLLYLSWWTKRQKFDSCRVHPQLITGKLEYINMEVVGKVCDSILRKDKSNSEVTFKTAGGQVGVLSGPHQRDDGIMSHIEVSGFDHRRAPYSTTSLRRKAIHCLCMKKHCVFLIFYSVDCYLRSLMLPPFKNWYWKSTGGSV